MPQRRKLVFNHRGILDRANPFEGLTFALRTDAHHATGILTQNLLNHFNAAADPAFGLRLRQSVHDAYRVWGHGILKAMAANLDYDRYGLTDPRERFLNVHFYNARQLADDAVVKGEMLVRQLAGHGKPVPVFYISLDDMIEPQTAHHGEIAFSRLFSATGEQLPGFRARPGKKPLDQQLDDIRELLKHFHSTQGQKLQIVLLEDNVRHAKMLNWVIDLMEQHKIFDHGDLAGISTCFCCASQAERDAIRHQGKTVPLTCVVDYKGAQIDVVTPRDLLFDGFVVETDDNTGRLPGIFMDVAKLFKIRPEKTVAFEQKVHRANVKFCETLEREFGVALPLKWFAGAGAISYIAGYKPETPMIDVLKQTNDTRRKQRSAFNAAP